jgi:hypothetical protein
MRTIPSPGIRRSGIRNGFPSRAKNGRAHNDTNMRRFREIYPLAEYPLGWLDTYQEKWDQLKAAASTGSSPSA